jgi:AcrR family transcriptional regulator
LLPVSSGNGASLDKTRGIGGPRFRKMSMSKESPAAVGQSSKERIIDAGEALIAEFGINGVTFREIGLAAGQNNKSAVQYHFGNKAALVNEILKQRHAFLDKKRNELFHEIESAGRLETVRACLELLYYPMAELTDKNGFHTYAKFYLQYMLNIKYENDITHPAFPGNPNLISKKVYEILKSVLWYLPESILLNRLEHIHGMLFVALLAYDNAIIHNEPHQPRDEFIDGLFNVMTAAIKAPLVEGRPNLDP